jgi:hypothetical protein
MARSLGGARTAADWQSAGRLGKLPYNRYMLDSFIDRFSPAIAAQARNVLARMRARLPGAIEMVYDKTNAVVVGFGPTERPSEAVFSIVVFPRWILLYFLQGAVLPDPHGLLKGAGKVGRHIRLTGPEMLDDPGVRELMDDAIELAEVPFAPGQKSKIILRSVVKKQRPRRPA